jgi:hypothetical protein
MMDLYSGIGISYALLVIVDRVIARVKVDYFTRGMGIVIFTNIIGIIDLVLSRSSRARLNDEHNIHGWPTNAYLAVFTLMSLIHIIAKIIVFLD